MKDLPVNVVLAKNKTASADAWLVLLEITLTDDTVFRLVKNNEDITFDGDVYTRFNFQLEPSEQSGKGNIPTITLRVSNITRLIEPYLQDLDGGIGSTVKIIVVNSGLLAEDFSELEMTFDVLGCNATNQWVIFTLGAPSPLRQRFPLGKYYALHCRWRFKSCECGYDGAGLTCDRTLAACRAYSNSIRFGGFPGMRSGGVRIA